MTDGSTDLPTDTARCRVACTRLNTKPSEDKTYAHRLYGRVAKAGTGGITGAGGKGRVKGAKAGVGR